jgi:hypothetical protein
MSDLLTNRWVTNRGAPAEPVSLPESWSRVMSDYASLIGAANGLLIRDGMFRVFGVGADAITRDAVAWNQESWRRRFDWLSDTAVFWAENVFGDQYGIDLHSRRIFLMSCEGGLIDDRSFGSVSECIEAELCADQASIEVALIEQARQHGICPSPSEHLSFTLPLIVGGSAQVENLEIMEAGAHLDLLGQILQQNRGLPEGTPIGKFAG